ncbi:MAG: hypothetical protein COV10_01650, partial [Candidatus Vogelbacteria bacterium CG10_big_fil_rev_8_21_14_0_10_51_16]
TPPTLEPTSEPPIGPAFPTPLPVPPPVPTGAVKFVNTWETSVDEFSAEFGGRLETDDPTVEQMTGSFSLTAMAPFPGGLSGVGGQLGFGRSSGFSFYQRVTGLDSDTEYFLELVVKTDAGEFRHMAVIRTLPKLETRLT